MLALKLLAEAAVDHGRLAQAKELAATIPMVEQDSDYQRIMSKIELAEDSADSPEIKALQAQVEEEPDNSELKIKLALALQQAHRDEEALDHAFYVMRKDPANADAKRLHWTLSINYLTVIRSPHARVEPCTA